MVLLSRPVADTQTPECLPRRGAAVSRASLARMRAGQADSAGGLTSQNLRVASRLAGSTVS